jgi:hypothetical protein
MKDLKQIQEFFSKPLEENTWPKELTSRYSDEYRFELQKVEPTYKDQPGRAKYHVIDIESGELKGTPVFGKVESLMAFADDLIKPQGGTQSTNLGEMDMNDPVMMKMRAAKNKKPDFGKEYGDAVKTAYGNDKNAKKLAFLKKERAQLMRDMEQEAEPEGGPIADEYGSKLNRIDAAIAKLSGRKEMTYDQAIAEGEGKMPTQDQVDRFFALTQNEPHYLNSKPVAGQEATFNLMKVEPWDEYDLSNFNSLVRKAKDKKSKFKKHGEMSGFDMRGIDEAQSRVSMPRFVKDKRHPNFLNVYIDYDLGPGGVLIALGKETMTGQIRRESAAEAMRLAGDVARDLEAEYNLEDIDVQDLENGVVQVFAVSDDFINMDPNMLGEIKKSVVENEATEDKIDIVTMDVPLFIRVLEYAREDAQEDMDLHDLAEKAIVATKQQGILAMDDYDMLVGDDSIEEANVTWSTLHKDNEDLNHTAKIYFMQQVRKGKIDQLPKDPKAEYMKLKLKGLVESSKNIVGDKQITKDQFSKLKGKGIVYNGSAWNVIDSNEYAIEIEKDGKSKIVNFAQFNKKGIAERLAKQLKETKPGLWANIHAKKARGEKPSHGNSKAHKSAVKAGKKINKSK